MKKITAQFQVYSSQETGNSLRTKVKTTISSLLTTINSQTGFSALAVITILGLFLAITLALVGTGTIKLPGNAELAVSPLQVSDPVEDDEACKDPTDADCEELLDNDPEDLTPAQIQKLLEEK